jgi:hypothetical protein
MSEREVPPHPVLPLVSGLDMAAKVVLLVLLALVVVNPDYGHLEGKAPLARALTYPLLALVVPVLWWGLWRSRRPYPWTADLMLTLTAFSDILGNRVNLYDTVVWFDDWMHFMNSALVGAAAVLLTLERTARLAPVVERSVVVAITASLGWELFEYLTFVTRSSEVHMAYSDTLGDLALGWLGGLAAGVVLHRIWRAHDTVPAASFPTTYPAGRRPSP